METRTLPHAEWTAFFGDPAHSGPLYEGCDGATLRRSTPDGASPAETRRLHFERLDYHPADELFEVVAAGLHHFVLRPEVVRVDEAGGRLRRLEFVFRNGGREVLDLN
jgi:hypothetical protein